MSSAKRNSHKIARRVWAEAHGPIPEGHVIHHRDKDVFNNDLENLECMEATVHLSMHGKESSTARTAAGRENIKVAKAAHMEKVTPEDYQALGRITWELTQERTLTCAHCGESYDVRTFGDTKYCSNACKSAARRASGVDNVTRFCLACGTAFLIDKYKKTQVCSRKCGWEQRKKKEATPDG